MQNLKILTIAQLIDLLVQQTLHYYEMMKDCIYGEEIARCNLVIRATQAEIDFRKKSGLTQSRVHRVKLFRTK